MDPTITSAVRDIFLMVAAGAFTALCLTAVVLVIKLYRPIRESVKNASSATENFRRISGDIAAVSEETAGNIAQTSRNLVAISENIKGESEDLSETVRAARDAANNVGATASTLRTIAETFSGISAPGASDGAGASAARPLLRLIRTMFGGGRRGNEGGEQDA